MMPDRNGITNIPIHEWIFQQIQDPLLFTNEAGDIIRCNQAALEVIGPERQTVRDLLDFKKLKDHEGIKKIVDFQTEGDRLYFVQCMRVRKEEGLYALLFRPLSISDQTLEVKREMDRLMDASSEGVVMHDHGRIVDCDSTFARMFGYKREEIRNTDVFSLVDEDSRENLKQLLHTYPEEPYQLKGKKKDGTTFFLEILAHPYPQEDRVLRVAIIRDVTERVHNEKKIEFMSYYDELTDLPNRHYFHDMLNEALMEAAGQGEGVAVHFIDLDYFKQINDTLGYAFGDKLLKACAERLKSIQEQDTFIARMGGDEFLVLQRYVTSKEKAEDYAEKMIGIFQRPVTIDDYELYTSVSIGISLFPDHGRSADDLIKKSDSAMFTVKGRHRNNYLCYNASISEKFEKMLSMDSELRKALKQEQLELHYQPQKSIGTGKIVGLEALIRWNHPDKGMISPATFIPIAEKNGQIIEIGEWVMKEACKQNKQWQDEGFAPVIVGVNLSALQFLQKDLVFRVKQILEETGLAPEYLELEITESMAMTNEEYIIHTLKELRELGVHVSIDDFGTGYSSLKYLSRFPVSKLKIDKVFISENQKQNQAIVKSIIHMSHSLNMKVIAEGVETAEQWNFLKNEKCDEIQGYFYSKPLPPEQLSDVFNSSIVH
ncbi:hypothetical protein HLI_02885 [Halobacillus litoralis]|uniref:GGDEF domain-containing protein n=2 Tax=Halobacillus litoralis TaxID=45668 RepID=A0A410M978_9BACI|nr:hypothetical protein HLI_02885 [Halobacillus litoralis]